MFIQGIDNQTVELSIHCYDEEPGTWFYIDLKVNSKLGNIEVLDPFLEDYDVKSIVNWLRRLGENKSDFEMLDFLEPNMALQVLSHDDNKKLIRLNFYAECRPKSMGNQDYYVDCLLTNAQLLQLSNDLLEELRRFTDKY